MITWMIHIDGDVDEVSGYVWWHCLEAISDDVDNDVDGDVADDVTYGVDDDVDV